MCPLGFCLPFANYFSAVATIATASDSLNFRIVTHTKSVSLFYSLIRSSTEWLDECMCVGLHVICAVIAIVLCICAVNERESKHCYTHSVGENISVLCNQSTLVAYR